MRHRRPQIPRGWLAMSMEQQSAVIRAAIKAKIPDGLRMKDGKFWTWEEIYREEKRVMDRVDSLPPYRRDQIKRNNA
jgi:hypothetical protein